jgi:hypothetical protein
LSAQRKTLRPSDAISLFAQSWLGGYYRRLRAAGKRSKVAMMAAMHKLLAAIYSVAKHRRAFLPKLTSTASQHC